MSKSDMLPDVFYTMPRYASTVLEKRALKKVLMNTGGRILSCGRLWDIKSKHLGGGVYKITLSKEE